MNRNICLFPTGVHGTLGDTQPKRDNLAKAAREGQIDTVHSPLSCISISTAGIAVLEVLNLLLSKY